MTTTLEPDRIQEDPAPADASPNALLAYIAEQDRKQTEALKFLAAQIKQQGTAIEIVRRNSYLLADYIDREQKAWHRMRQYIGCMFWLWIGLPLLFAVGLFVLSTMGGVLALSQ